MVRSDGVYFVVMGLGVAGFGYWMLRPGRRWIDESLDDLNSMYARWGWSFRYRAWWGRFIAWTALLFGICYAALAVWLTLRPGPV
ncbi:MAG: hypothetical protein WBA31_04355 [Candidatus Dormiibacterota bacterium]